MFIIPDECNLSNAIVSISEDLIQITTETNKIDIENRVFI